MQNLPTIEIMQRALRSQVCTICLHRPAGSESLSADIRPCECSCPIFVNLETLRKLALRSKGSPLSPFEFAIRELICQKCKSSPTSGDYCAEHRTRNCPLSRHAGVVVATLEKIPATRPRRPAANKKGPAAASN